MYATRQWNLACEEEKWVSIIENRDENGRQMSGVKLSDKHVLNWQRG